jgi:hypothetical protein
MIKTASRFYELQKSGKKAYDANGNLKQGSEYKSFQNAWGSKNIIVIFNWKDGLLHSDENTPAIQMSDTHTEYWINGKISNIFRDVNGEIMPAIISNYGEIQEKWINGTRIE